jgi:hypothetical protein
MLPHRDYSLCVRHEDNQDELRFERVEALRVTHHRACTTDMVSAYDRVTCQGETPWLDEMRRQLQSSGEPSTGLQHLRLYLDGGPCYEFICHGFTATTTQVA